MGTTTNPTTPSSTQQFIPHSPTTAVPGLLERGGGKLLFGLHDVPHSDDDHSRYNTTRSSIPNVFSAPNSEQIRHRPVSEIMEIEHSERSRASKTQHRASKDKDSWTEKGAKKNERNERDYRLDLSRGWRDERRDSSDNITRRHEYSPNRDAIRRRERSPSNGRERCCEHNSERDDKRNRERQRTYHRDRRRDSDGRNKDDEKRRDTQRDRDLGCDRVRLHSRENPHERRMHNTRNTQNGHNEREEVNNIAFLTKNDHQEALIASDQADHACLDQYFSELESQSKTTNTPNTTTEVYDPIKEETCPNMIRDEKKKTMLETYEQSNTSSTEKEADLLGKRTVFFKNFPQYVKEVRISSRFALLA